MVLPPYPPFPPYYDPTLENNNQSSPANEDKMTCAKEQLGSEKCDTKLLGISRNKSEDTLSIVTLSRKKIERNVKRSRSSQKSMTRLVWYRQRL